MGSLLISVIGNLLYSSGYVTNMWVIFFGRFLVGFGSGTLSPIRASIADATTKEQRVRFMALSNATQFLGFAIVPGFAGLLYLFDFQFGWLKIDQFTSAGLILALMNGLAIIAVFYFVPTNNNDQYKLQQNLVPQHEERPIKRFQIWTGIFLFITLNLVTRGVLALLETVGAPIFVDVWDSNKEDAVKDSSQMFLILGVIGLGMYFCVDYIRRIISEHTLLTISFVLTGAGALFFITWNPEDKITLVEFLIGAIIIWSIASPIAQTLILSSFSKMLGTAPQGSAMGWIGSAGSIGRIIFPLIAGLLSHNSSFAVSSILSFVCAGFVLLYRYQITIHEFFIRTVQL